MFRILQCSDKFYFHGNIKLPDGRLSCRIYIANDNFTDVLSPGAGDEIGGEDREAGGRRGGLLQKGTASAADLGGHGLAPGAWVQRRRGF